MNKRIEEVEFTVFDTETTGLEPELGDRIVEIAAIRLKGQERIGEFHALVDPGRDISPAAFAINKITPQMLKQAPQIKTVLPNFLAFIKGSCLCSYNAGFDLGFLNNELKICGFDELKDALAVDILKMSRRLLPGLGRYALWFVAAHLGINTKQEHRALADVELTIAVFDKLKNMLLRKGISDFLNFSSLFSINPRILEDINARKVSEIQEAINLGMKLKIKYLSSSKAEVSEREVIPKQVRQDKNTAYLVAHCCSKNEERTFRVDGILHFEIV